MDFDDDSMKDSEDTIFPVANETNHGDSDDIASCTTSDEKTADIGDMSINIDVGGKHIVRAASQYGGFTPKQQQEIAQDMFSQMKQLKAHNEVMGYHGFSGLLERHDSNMNLTTKSESNISALKDGDEDADTLQNIQLLRRHRNVHKNNLSETQPLRQKLEVISGSINRIRQDLQDQTFDKETISIDELNETIMSFHNQLTEIQDQIEDAENDIECKIDVKIIKYQEEIKVNKQKIKSLKKEKREREKQLLLDKDKEQQKIIDLQRMQIDQLIRSQSNAMLHAQFSGDTQTKRTQRDSVCHSVSSISNNEEEEDDDNGSYRELEHIQNGSMHDSNLPKIDSFVPMVRSPGTQQQNRSASGPLFSPFRDEGHYKYQNRLHFHLQQERESMRQQAPLLSDNAIKIIGGVTLGLSIIWILSKFIDRNSKGEMTVYRPPRLKY